MKKILIIVTSIVAGIAYAAPAMNVFTINTSDPMGYMKWARESAPVTSPSSNTSAGNLKEGILVLIKPPGTGSLS